MKQLVEAPKKWPREADKLVDARGTQNYKAAAEILARPDVGTEDRSLLQAALARAKSPGALSALAYGLAAATSDPHALRVLLQSRRRDPGCPPDLHATLDSLLAALDDLLPPAQTGA